jgi:hypothetical protein
MSDLVDKSPIRPLITPVKLKKFLIGVVAALALPFQASAVNTEYSDLWWNPNESGWGVGLQRQDDVIFLTLFVYGADGKNTWFVAPDVKLLTPDTKNSTWQGALYSTTGPAFSAPYDSNVQSTQVGAATIAFTNAELGTLTYTVNGAQVVKQISRMTWRQPSVAGSYFGGYSTQIPQCEGDPQRIGEYDFNGNMTVTEANGRVVAAWASGETGGSSNCTFTATNVRQAGRLGFWSGTFACSVYIGCDYRCEGSSVVRRSGTFQLDDVAVNQSGFHGVLTARDQDCTFTGYMGGTRKP